MSHSFIFLSLSLQIHTHSNNPTQFKHTVNISRYCVLPVDTKHCKIFMRLSFSKLWLLSFSPGHQLCSCASWIPYRIRVRSILVLQLLINHLSIIRYKALRTKPICFHCLTSHYSVAISVGSIFTHLIYGRLPAPSSLTASGPRHHWNCLLSTTTSSFRAFFCYLISCWFCFIFGIIENACNDHTREVTKTPKGLPKAAGNYFIHSTARLRVPK